MRAHRQPQRGEHGLTPPDTAATIADELAVIRRRTRELVEPLPQERLARQVRPFMSPLIWDIGHIAEFERLWLVSSIEDPDADGLEERFDALGTPRRERGALDLPAKADALARLEQMRKASLATLARVDLRGGGDLVRDGFVYRMVMQHEAQHQETMLQALDIPAEDWGYAAAGARPTAEVAAQETRDVDDTQRVRVAGGPFTMGTTDRRRAYDNERPAHHVEVAAFDIERYPVSNRRWREFIDDGGYRRGELWSDAGRDWLATAEVEQPQGWRRCGDTWRVWRFGAEVALADAEPVQHVSYWEAEAFARWSGARLPSAAEWEKAAAWSPTTNESRTYPWGEAAPTDVCEVVDVAAFSAARPWGPPPIGARPQAASAVGVEDLLGAVYQWTTSELRPYPGFKAFPYPEYSEVFFGDSYRVLRGSSWAAHPLLWRNSYRNWDLPERRQIFAGVRLVYDL